jgi:ankyrin repeat protein
MRLLIISIFILPMLSFGQMAIKGSLWEYGASSECNWYFADNLACMEIIPEKNENGTTAIRVIMDATSKKITLVTENVNGSNYFSTSMDSIKGQVQSLVQFQKTGTTKEFDQLGTCVKYQAKTHENEYIAFLFDAPSINLGLFKAFFKDDELFGFLATELPHSFPAQSITVKANGELQRSFQASSTSTKFFFSVFEIPSGAVEIKN